MRAVDNNSVDSHETIMWITIWICSNEESKSSGPEALWGDRVRSYIRILQAHSLFHCLPDLSSSACEAHGSTHSAVCLDLIRPVAHPAGQPCVLKMAGGLAQVLQQRPCR
jgi:hypothetical protein